MDEAALLSSLHSTYFSPPWDEAAIRALMAHGAQGWFIAHDNHDVGFALVRCAADEAELLSIAVLPKFRELGLAAVLLESLCQELSQAAVYTLFLEVASDNKAARRLYEHHGFTSIGNRPGYYANGADALTYRRALG